MLTFLARCWLRLWRWTTVPPSTEVPDRCVVIAAPHTSNWDFPVTLAMARVSGVPIRWLGKKQLFRGPMGPIMRALGGISVDRSGPGGLVEALVREFGRRDRLVLVVPAEGTRDRTEYWKSGFYRIALAAEVPVLCCFVDGPSRSGGFGPVLRLTGDVRADMEPIRAFYADKEGLKPGRFGPVRLREEDVDDEGAETEDPTAPVA